MQLRQRPDDRVPERRVIADPRERLGQGVAAPRVAEGPEGHRSNLACRSGALPQQAHQRTDGTGLAEDAQRVRRAPAPPVLGRSRGRLQAGVDDGEQRRDRPPLPAVGQLARRGPAQLAIGMGECPRGLDVTAATHAGTPSDD